MMATKTTTTLSSQLWSLMSTKIFQQQNNLFKSPIINGKIFHQRKHFNNGRFLLKSSGQPSFDQQKNRLPDFNNNNDVESQENFKQNVQSIKNKDNNKINNEIPEFPGMRSKFITELNFLDRCDEDDVIPPFRVLDFDGNFLSKFYEHQLDLDLMKRFYREIVKLNQMDDILNQAQRQGRISFYMTSYGEEATHFGPAAALKGQDLVFGQYREPGVLMWRGFTFEQFINQLYGNQFDTGKGRQMPIHYGSRELNYMTIKSTLATGMPHAVGAAYGFKLTNQDRVTLCYFGDGAASEGDAHAAFNFAATIQCPIIFLCRNNGYAISTPIKEQYQGDGIVVRGPAMGIPSIRIDGNDVLACYHAVQEARKICIHESRPVLIEAMTFRIGHHSTSDDSSVYRSDDEVRGWKERAHPLHRIEKLLKKHNLLNENEERELKNTHRKDIIGLIERQEKVMKWPIKEMFADVYDQMPLNLQQQYDELMEHLRLYKEHYPEIAKFKQPNDN